jgi:hypothetical protein
MVANVHERTSLDGWHKHLGHPSQKLVTQIIKSFSLPIKHKDHVSYLCTSCSNNKTHKQPFRPTSLVSHAPLDLIYTDVWGPSNIVGLDGSRFYLILVDHFTKYIWFYPMSNKSYVSSIFPQFKHLVEKKNFIPKSKVIIQIMVVNLLPSNNIFLYMELVTTPLPLIHLNKMVYRNVAIVT